MDESLGPGRYGKVMLARAGAQQQDVTGDHVALRLFQSQGADKRVMGQRVECAQGIAGRKWGAAPACCAGGGKDAEAVQPCRWIATMKPEGYADKLARGAGEIGAGHDSGTG